MMIVWEVIKRVGRDARRVVFEFLAPGILIVALFFIVISVLGLLFSGAWALFSEHSFWVMPPAGIAEDPGPVWVRPIQNGGAVASLGTIVWVLGYLILSVVRYFRRIIEELRS